MYLFLCLHFELSNIYLLAVNFMNAAFYFACNIFILHPFLFAVVFFLQDLHLLAIVVFIIYWPINVFLQIRSTTYVFKLLLPLQFFQEPAVSLCSLCCMLAHRKLKSRDTLFFKIFVSLIFEHGVRSRGGRCCGDRTGARRRVKLLHL